MSGQLRTLKTRIRSVENTKKITRAMEMVAAAKLHRFQTMMTDAQPYTAGLENMVKRIHQAQLANEKDQGKKDSESTVLHPFFEQREEKRAAYVVITSDAGLCGSYNTDLINTAFRALRDRQERPPIIGIGKMGISALRKQGYEFLQTYTDLRASRIEEVLVDFKTLLEKLYLDREIDAIYVVYSHFLNLSHSKAIVEKLLPLEEPDVSGEEATSNQPLMDYIYEPDPKSIFEKLIPLFFEAKTRMVFLESFVSEQIARMNAMHQATKNAKEMIDSLVLLRNKIRQAAITKELIEIVSGSQALKLK